MDKNIEYQPSWSHGGARAIFQHLGQKYGLKEFIETGTGYGDTISFMHRVFDNVYSIERDDWKYEIAARCFAWTPNVHLIHGDSAIELPKLLASKPDVPTLFWLDAHGAPGIEDGPLALEIKTVLKYRPTSLIAIDDVGPNTHHDTELSNVKSSGLSLDGLVMEYRFDKVMFIHNGQYDTSNLD